MLQKKEETIVKQMSSTDELKDEPVVKDVEGVKVDEKYLSSIKELQQKVAEIKVGLGSIEMDFIHLEDQKQSLKDALRQLIKKEGEIAQEIENQYGIGSLDLETGLFTKQ
jgi:predicted nuclease with TOPRIM domain